MGDLTRFQAATGSPVGGSWLLFWKEPPGPWFLVGSVDTESRVWLDSKLAEDRVGPALVSTGAGQRPQLQKRDTTGMAGGPMKCASSDVTLIALCGMALGSRVA